VSVSGDLGIIMLLNGSKVSVSGDLGIIMLLNGSKSPARSWSISAKLSGWCRRKGEYK
jgi:hypothetical protein